MDPIKNPFAPGAGTQPQELAGRDALREKFRVATQRIRIGNSAKSILLIGLRGVGKTVLLNRMRLDAEKQGLFALHVEAQEDRSLPSLLASPLRTVLLRLSRTERAKHYCMRALRALAGFAKSLKVKYTDIDVAIDFDPEPGLADNGILEDDLTALFQVVGEAAKAAETEVILYADELQNVADHELESLVRALHETTQQRLPVMLAGAGLPHLPGRMGKAKTYAERLFDYSFIGHLAPGEARQALAVPARTQGVEFTADALDHIAEITRGYPYFLQEWGSQAWEAASCSPITLEDVEQATVTAIAALDEGFFRVRFDRLTPREKSYLRAMADLGSGPYSSGEIAGRLARPSTALAPLRSKLIAKGMIWSPAHGETAFTVPMFDQFMRRIMPDSR
jgi:hypothetical protein